MKFRIEARSQRALLPAFLVGLLLIGLSSLSFGQDVQYPKWDVFTGYQWLHPGGNVPSPFGTFNAPISQTLPDSPFGVGAAAAYNFNKVLGLETDYGKNWTTNGKGMNEQTLSLGPRFMLRTAPANFFVHGMVSWNRLSAPGLNTDNNIGAIAGGGVDIPILKRLTIRPVAADYVWARHNYSSYVSPSFPDLRRPDLNGVRLRSGLLWNFDYPPTTPPSAACSVTPTEVMQGEPVTASATASNFNPKHSLDYMWSGNGGKVAGKDNGASIDTTGVAGGSYTVTANVKDPKMKKGGETSCTASYTVKEPPKNPPTMSCSASPSSLEIGNTTTVSCTCTSPDNVPVSVSNWTASSGTVSGSGNSATLNTTGASEGTTTVSATCTDSRGLSSQSSASVSLTNPPTQLEAKLTIGRSVYFPTAKPSPSDPTGGLEPSQQKTLSEFATDFKQYLQARPNASITLEGHADPRGGVAYNQALSQRRVDRVKSFLVEQGVPEAAIQTQALGEQQNLTDQEVKDQVTNNPDLTQEEKDRIMKNEKVIIWAANRRVDISLNGTNQTSVRHLPFHAADSLSIIGGRTSEMKTKKPMPKKKAAPPSQ